MDDPPAIYAFISFRPPFHRFSHALETSRYHHHYYYFYFHYYYDYYYFYYDDGGDYDYSFSYVSSNRVSRLTVQVVIYSLNRREIPEG